MPEKRFLSQLFNCIAGCALFLLIMTSSAFGQRNYMFENISVPEGLSNSTVNYIFQDSNGFLWISTLDGLNRYNGNSFKVFKNDPNDSTSLPTNDCYAIAEDADGFLWVGVSNNIIAKYDPKNEAFQSYPIETVGVNMISFFYSALFDSKGNLWFGSTYHGMQKLNKSKNKFEQVHLDDSDIKAQWGNIFSIKELKNGNMIVSDYANGIKIYNEKLNLFQPFYLKADYSPVEIQTIYEDISGNIWFGGNVILIKYSPKYYTTEDYDIFGPDKNGKGNYQAMGMVQDVDGYMWIGTYSQGLFRIDANTKTFQTIDYGSTNSDIAARIIIQSVIKDKYGVVWIGTWGNGLTKFDPLREPFNFYKFIPNDIAGSNANFSTVIVGAYQSKEITIGTSESGLFNYNLEKHKSENLKFKTNKPNASGGKINIQGLAIDNEGNKWLAYNNQGLNKIARNGLVTPVKSPNENKTTTYTVNSIKIDLKGNIWMASMHGFEKYNPSQNQYTFLPTIMNKPMSEDLKHKIHKIAESSMPIASILKVGEASNLEKSFSLSHDQKVLIISVGEGETQFGLGLSDAGSILNEDGKTIWSVDNLFRTFNDGGGFKNRIALGCINLEKGNYKLTYATDVGHSYGHWNIIPPSDSLWYGIQVLSLNDADYSIINEMNEKEINSDKFMPISVGTSIEFSKKYDNMLWLGSRLGGFFKYDLATGNFRQYNYDAQNVSSLNNYINCIFEDNEGIVWIATANSLLRFDPTNEKMDRYDQNNGLPSNQINSITEDLEGNLWINTSSGLSKLNKNALKEKWNFVNFDVRDGLPGYSSSKAIWMNNDGEIFLGNNEGIVSFYPGNINEVKPDVVLEDIKVSDVSLKSDSAAAKLQKSIMKLDELKLSYTQNNISFEFESIHFSRPEKNKILYKLEGFNTHWISTDRNFVSYTNLSPGKYTFFIKGSNGDGIWNDTGKSLRIIISPPWWKTTLAYISYSILLLLFGFGFDRIQRRRIQEKQRALAKDKELAQAREIEKAYTELKATQAQLIQSEKMASLGELTAGIAHEIQNPLNFVNNFSEVSTELVDEMKDELVAGNWQLATELADDVKQNLEKINHHGKRAADIVKGMLQHSRTSSGVKEPTDINALADEYLRLAYHGLRAKDKSFNATMKTDFDETIGKIDIIPQDIGRVILNLITNAFYSVKAPLPPEGGFKDPNYKHEPTVWVSTKKVGGKVLISVRDNGSGIPPKILDKIFQPFFTTKPTGEGTGLGLSMSYEIVTKAHHGELKVETKEGEGSVFTIVLPV